MIVRENFLRLTFLTFIEWTSNSRQPTVWASKFDTSSPKTAAFWQIRRFSALETNSIRRGNPKNPRVASTWAEDVRK